MGIILRLIFICKCNQMFKLVKPKKDDKKPTLAIFFLINPNNLARPRFSVVITLELGIFSVSYTCKILHLKLIIFIYLYAVIQDFPPKTLLKIPCLKTFTNKTSNLYFLNKIIGEKMLDYFIQQILWNFCNLLHLHNHLFRLVSRVQSAGTSK